MKNIVLIGFMGSGKTTVGKELSKATGLPLIDADDYFIEKTGVSIADFFSSFGEKAFREKEELFLTELLGKSAIIATGGGVVLAERTRKLLAKTSNVFWLNGSFSTLSHRLYQETDSVRPLVKQYSPEELELIYVERMPFYQEAAGYQILIDDKNVEEIAREIMSYVEEEIR